MGNDGSHHRLVIVPETITSQSHLPRRPNKWEVFTLPHRFLTESGHSCGFRRNPQELNLAGTSAKFSIRESPNSGGMESFRNWNWNGPGIDRNGIWRSGINIKILNEYDTAAKWQRRHPKKHVTSSNNSKHHTTSNVTTSPL